MKPTTLSLLSLFLSFIAFILSIIAFIIHRDNNIINWVRMNLDLMKHMPKLDPQDKERMKNMLRKNRIYKKKEFKELEERIMSL